MTASDLRYMAMEGGVCAGKTTLSNRIAELRSLLHVPEYYDIISPHDKAHLATSTPRERLAYFVALDTKRSETFKIKEQPVVADRSILSIVATEYALNKMNSDHSLTDILSLNVSRFAVPSTVIFLKIPPEERALRWARRSPTGSKMFFIDPTFNLFFEEFFHRSAHLCNVHFINNYHVSIDDVVSTICEIPTPGRSADLNSLLRNMG